MNAADGAAADGEVLGVGGHGAAVHVADAGDDTVAGHFLVAHAEVMGVVLGVQTELHESVGLKEGVDALAGAHEALLFALGEFVEAAGGIGPLAFFFELFKQCWVDGHGGGLVKLQG